MINRFPEEVFETLVYYVYRLIDPRNGKTFYVGKGCRNRVFAHVNAELKFYEDVDEMDFVEDEISAKMQTIHEIREAGLKVIHIIHRYGMTEKEAMEVESALIDAYGEFWNLTNVQSGYNPDRGMVYTDKLIQSLGAPEYNEPNNISYVIIKTTERAIENNGSLYEATRRAWRLDLNKVDHWYRSEDNPKKVEFVGNVAEDNIRKIFVDKRLPQVYRQPCSMRGAVYSKHMIPSEWK